MTDDLDKLVSDTVEYLHYPADDFLTSQHFLQNLDKILSAEPSIVLSSLLLKIREASKLTEMSNLSTTALINDVKHAKKLVNAINDQNSKRFLSLIGETYFERIHMLLAVLAWLKYAEKK